MKSALVVMVMMALPLKGQVDGGERSPVDVLERPPVTASSSVPAGDERAEGLALAREVWRALGGEKGWADRSWSLAFDFVAYRDGKEVARFSHNWNRRTNAAVVSGMGRDGRRWEVRFSDIYARSGTATINGAPAPESDLPKLLDNAYARFINDSYWLLMPLKILDDGVIHRRLADTTVAGERFERLALSFERVGLTPGDQYQLYIDPKTKRVVRWTYVLESGRTGDNRWEGYEQIGPVTLPLVRRAPDGTVAIRFENVRSFA
jgi:hypothetical protein